MALSTALRAAERSHPGYYMNYLPAADTVGLSDHDLDDEDHVMSSMVEERLLQETSLNVEETALDMDSDDSRKEDEEEEEDESDDDEDEDEEEEQIVGLEQLLHSYRQKNHFKWLKEQGGTPAMEERNLRKSGAVYGVIDGSRGFYHCPIAVDSRSRMNVPFRIGGPDGDPDLEKKFLQEASELGMIQLKGHRSVGGIRVSLYNAVTVEETYTLVEFMKNFQQRHQ